MGTAEMQNNKYALHYKYSHECLLNGELIGETFTFITG